MPKKKNLKKWPFLDQKHGLTPFKNVNFSTFWTCCFYSLESRFLVLEYHKRHFPGLFCLKTKLKKRPLLDQIHGLTPLEKCQFFDFWTCCFYSLESRFLVLEYNKRHFPGHYCLKKELGKMAIFGPKPWVNLFGKMSIVRLFGLLVFIA